MDWYYAWALPYAREDQPRALRPIVLRALIGPDGRIVLAEVAQSSGAPERDRAALGAWVEHGHRADLAATARGRFAWVELPPIDPLLTTSQAWERWNGTGALQ